MQADMERQVSEITKHELSVQQRLRGTQDAYEGIGRSPKGGRLFWQLVANSKDRRKQRI